MRRSILLMPLALILAMLALVACTTEATPTPTASVSGGPSVTSTPTGGSTGSQSLTTVSTPTSSSAIGASSTGATSLPVTPAATGTGAASSTGGTPSTGAQLSTTPAGTAGAIGPFRLGAYLHPLLGPLLTDSQGRTLYLFLNDRGGAPTCAGTCAQNWPPFTVSAAMGTPVSAGATSTTSTPSATGTSSGTGVSSTPTAGATAGSTGGAAGATSTGTPGGFSTGPLDGDTRLLGTVTRADGTVQVTYMGWPLYYFASDSKPGDVMGNGQSSKWWVVSPAQPLAKDLVTVTPTPSGSGASTGTPSATSSPSGAGTTSTGGQTLATPSPVTGTPSMTGGQGASTPSATGTVTAGPEGIQQAIQAGIAAWNGKDVHAFLDLFTDAGLQSAFDLPRDQAVEALQMFIGDPPLTDVRFSNAQVSGNSGGIEAQLHAGKLIERHKFTLTMEGSAWKIDADEYLPVAIPSGVTAVDVSLIDFAFQYDPLSIRSGNIAFNVSNDGTQDHELALAKVPADVSIQDILSLPEDADPSTIGAEFIGSVMVKQGEKTSMVFTGPLDPGHYVMLCFLPDTKDPNHAPHAFKGMVSEFTVPGGASGPGATGAPTAGSQGLATPSPAPGSTTAPGGTAGGQSAISPLVTSGAVQALVQAAVIAWETKDPNAFRSYLDNSGLSGLSGLADMVQVSERASEVVQNAVNIDHISSITFSNAKLSDSGGSVDVQWTYNDGTSERHTFTVRLQNGVWMVDVDNSGTFSATATPSTSGVQSGAGTPSATVSPSISGTPSATGTPSTSQAANGVTYHVTVGAEDTSQGIEAGVFMPDDLTVNVGDTVVFTLNTHEPHTVTFNPPGQLPDPFMPGAGGSVVANPEVFLPSQDVSGLEPNAQPGTPQHLTASFDGTGVLNSGFMQNVGDTFTVTFTEAGSFGYQCLIHPMMKGWVNVNPAGSDRPKTAADVQAEAKAEEAREIQEGQRFLDSIQAPEPTANADGSHTYTVFAGASDPSDTDDQNDLMAFIGGQDLHIKVGDTVTWDMSMNMPGTPHTVTFTSGGEEPELIQPEPNPNGPPTLVVNPEVLAPSPAQGGGSYAGTGYYNSGLLIASGPTPQTYSLKFTKAGAYEYICVFHDMQGMSGTITVSE